VDRVEALSGTRFDLLVIGGGIIGAGIAEAASAGLSERDRKARTAPAAHS